MIVNWLRKHWKLTLGVILLVICLTLWITATSDHWLSKFILKYFNSWSIALSAAATIILAVAAFESIMENRRIRAEERKRESELRLFDENRRSLEEICNWAEKGIAALTSAGASSSLDIMDMQDTLPTIAAKNISIMDDARSLPSDKLGKELIKKVDNAAFDLQEFISFLNSKKQSAAKEPEYAPKRDYLKKSFENVIEVASKLKVALKTKL